MNCSPTMTTDNLVSFFWFCKCRWQDHHPSFSWFWSSYRKALTESACEKRYQNSCIWTSFPRGGGWLLSTADFLRSRVPPCGSFTYCSDGRSRGNARESVHIATPDSSLHCLWRKEWWYPFKPLYPYCKCGDTLSFQGPGQTALKEAWFASHPQWRKCSWFRIWYYSAPI